MNMQFDGLEGKLTSSKWAKIAKCSSGTALNDINDLIAKGILQKTDEGGRSEFLQYTLREIVFGDYIAYSPKIFGE